MEIVESQVLVLLLYMAIFYGIFMQLIKIVYNEETKNRMATTQSVPKPRTRQRSSRNLLMMRLIKRN